MIISIREFLLSLPAEFEDGTVCIVGGDLALVVFDDTLVSVA